MDNDLCMSVFVSVLTFQSVITTRADGAGGRALKFAVSSFVPVVGGALGESLASVRGGLKLLKSGSGVFMIFGIAFMFLPVLIRCLLWICSLNISASIGDILGTDSVCKLLRSVSKVVSTITAVLLCVMTVFILSTVLILIIGVQVRDSYFILGSSDLYSSSYMWSSGASCTVLKNERNT